ncbi:hypothetical protein LEP1GSC166_1921 [Leptospira kirschneri]|uniref:hypothetical protein n=1 Tax=Leptospira kirschneri TaxID=29507 RepID=UPI0002BFD353|nr:hypothetical protein [Leptospira kirschneri]EMK02927.1 hypothetical protein LEP1GSC166_1921 [Leptospira kirschneri]
MENKTEEELIDQCKSTVAECRKKIIEYIRSSGTLRQIEKWTKISNGNIANYINDKKKVHIETLIKIAEQIRDNKE